MSSIKNKNKEFLEKFITLSTFYKTNVYILIYLITKKNIKKQTKVKQNDFIKMNTFKHTLQQSRRCMIIAHFLITAKLFTDHLSIYNANIINICFYILFTAEC